MWLKKPLPELFHAHCGSILVVVMWIVSMLVILVAGLAGLVSARVHYFKDFRDSARAYLVAKGAINKAITELNKKPVSKGKGWDALREPWSTNVDEFKEINLDSGSATISCERYGLDNNAVTFYGMLDEESRIDLNAEAKRPGKDISPVLTDLFINVGEVESEEAQQIVAAIQDWIDDDYKPREGGTEDDYYLSLDPSYECKDTDFDVVEELLLVKGITPEIFMKVKDHLTVFSKDYHVNINTAGWGVLRALGLCDELTRKVMRFRAGDDGIEGTEDDGVITEASQLASQIGAVIPLSVDEGKQLVSLFTNNLITEESKYYRIHAKGTVNDKTRQIICVVERGGLIVAWQEP